jgi:hypothetical protein
MPKAGACLEIVLTLAMLMPDEKNFFYPLTPLNHSE